MIDLMTARQLRSGETIYSMTSFDRRGEPHRARLTSAPKLWKTRPQDIEIRAKFGMYEYLTITAAHLEGWTLDRDEARAAWLDQEIKRAQYAVSTATARPNARTLARLRQLEEERDRLRAQLDPSPTASA